MGETLSCPTCETVVVPDDVNVAKDVAYCRKCNVAFSLSELVHDGEDERVAVAPDPAVDFNQPPKGVWFEQTFEGFVIGATTRSALGCFLVPFMCVWSGGSLGGIYGTQIINGQFSLFQTLFGIPFLIGTVIIGSLAVMCVIGRVVLTVDRDSGSVFTGVGKIGFTKRFEWKDVTRVYEEEKRGSKGSVTKQIVLEGKDRITFGSMLSDNRRYFILQVLKKMLIK
jgi:hypothetical protein